MTAIKSLFKKRADVDMTSGNIFRHLLIFAFPLLLGNLFQQLYNTVDTWVVGNFVSNEAFSAVGSVAPICNLLIGFFSGLATGAGVIISQHYGAHREQRVSDAVHTAMTMTIILGVLFTVIGLLMTPILLNIMDPPDIVRPEAEKYLNIYFIGISGLMIYNMGAGILRAVGDSTRPFFYLALSAVTNIVLDLLFVLHFGMGVDGVAWATVIAQFLSALCVVIDLLRYKSCIKLCIRKLSIDFKILRDIFRVGIPAALQMAITAFSNVFVMKYINYFGADCTSGWTAYIKLDQFMMLPVQSISMAVTTFVGQNLGAGLIDRAKRGVRQGLLMSLIVMVTLMLPLIIFAPSLTAFFNDKAEVVEFGTLFLRFMSPFYVTLCVNQTYACALRGAGNSRAPMITMLASFVLFRQAYLFVMSNFISNTVMPIVFGYPAGWIVCSLSMYIYYHKVGLVSKEELKKITEG